MQPRRNTSYEHEPDTPEFIDVLKRENHMAFTASIGDILDVAPNKYSSDEWIFNTSAGIYDISVSKTDRSTNHPDFLTPQNQISISYLTHRDDLARLDLQFATDNSAALFFSKPDESLGSPLSLGQQVILTNGAADRLSNILSQLRSTPEGNQLIENQCDLLVESVYETLNKELRIIKPASDVSMIMLQKRLKAFTQNVPSQWVSRLTTETMTQNIYDFDDEIETEEIEAVTIKRYPLVTLSPKLDRSKSPNFKSSDYPAHLAPQYKNISYLIAHTQSGENIDVTSSLAICNDGTVRDGVEITGNMQSSPLNQTEADIFANLTNQGVLRTKIDEFYDLCADVTRLLRRY